MIDCGFIIVLGGIDNYFMLVDLCSKYFILIGKVVEKVFVFVDIIVNKNMVLFDSCFVF